MTDDSQILEGGCHCGAVRFRVEVRDWRVVDCNCSICTMKGFLHLIVPQERFVLTTDESALATYRFNTGVAAHHFCRTCGIHSFYVPRSHPDAIDVNVRCLDGTPIDRFDIEAFDGGNWEANVQSIEHFGS